MRRIAIAAISVLALLLVPGGVNAAHTRRKTPAKCTQVHARLITADGQAQVYEATEPEAFPEYLGVWGCAYGHKRPFFLGPLPYGSSSNSSAGVEHETLAGPIVAYEEYYSAGPRSGSAEWHVVVRDLRTGRVLHRVPTGAPLEPKPGYVGVGNVVSIVVKSDGAVAWLADDYERSGTAHGTMCTRSISLAPACWPPGPKSIRPRWHCRSAAAISAKVLAPLLAARSTGRRAANRCRPL